MEKEEDLSKEENSCRDRHGNVNCSENKVSPGMSIVMSRWIGLEGTSRIVREHRKEVSARLPVRMIQQMETFGDGLPVSAEKEIAACFDVCDMREIRAGGIWRGLWELAEDHEVGLTVQLWSIPVRQETIEVCEIFGLNPYELLSGGAFLMVTDRGEALATELEKAGIHGAVIGQITDSHDRIVLHRTSQGMKKRYLNRPGADEIEKL